jgi:hypothetical protein
MPSSGMICPVALVRTDDSGERSTSMIRVTRARNNVSRNLQPTHAAKNYYVTMEALVGNIRLWIQRSGGG